MKPGGKRVIFRAMAVLVIVVGVIVLAFMPPEDPREAKARRLIAELPDPGRIRKWLVKLGVVQPAKRRPGLTIAEELAALGQSAVPACIESLEDDQHYVRYYAAVAMGMIGPGAEEAVPALIGVLDDEDRAVRTGAAEALGKIGPGAKESVPALSEALQDKHERVRAAAGEALGKMGPGAKDAIPALTEALNDEDEGVRLRAAEALGKLGLPGRAVPVLIAALEDESAYVRCYAAWTLCEIGPPAKAAIPALTKVLKDEDEEVREAAAEALGKMGLAAREAVPTLEGALKDEQRDVRWAAARALAKLGVLRTALPVLIAELENQLWGYRKQAARILGEIGPPAKDAIPALKEALNDKDEDVRKAAAEALKKIQAAPATRPAATTQPGGKQ